MSFTVYRKLQFNAAHRLHNLSWSAKKNREVFGLCNSENYHGHNYTLIVGLTGPQDPETGYVYDMKRLGDLLRQEIEARYDHRNLNLDVDDFKGSVPSTENFARVIYNRLRPHIALSYDLEIILYETEKNYVRYKP